MNKDYRNWLKENYAALSNMSDEEIDALAESIEDGNNMPESLNEPTEKDDLTGKCLMELMERLAELSRCAEESPRVVIDHPMIAHYAKELGARLNLTPIQALLLSLFVNCYPDAEITSRDLAKHLGCTNLAILSCYEDIKVLQTKHYISEHKSKEDIEYCIPLNVITSFRENHDVTPADYRNLSPDDLFMELNSALRSFLEVRIDYEELYDTFTAIISSNPQLLFCRQLNEYQLNKDDWMLLARACCEYYYCKSSPLEPDDIRRMFPMRVGMNILRQFRQNRHPLLERNLMEPAGGELASAQEWVLSHRAAKDLMSEVCSDLMETAKRGVIEADTVVAKSLFYPSHTSQQISELESLLMPEKFDSVQESLTRHGMRKGFACLFYGAPGTGKTETVLQVARKTGRDIMQVDMSQMRDKYVGESEKNVKAVFTRYRRLCQESDRTPILLLNEADALLSVRLSSMHNAVDQMANTMQNIILQEMENLDGILIATTNLTSNLDAAFERRFLYKVEFLKPTAEESRHIWQAMLPSLSEENARTLASKYDFSGGQIENIARKQVVSNILHNTEELDMSLIHSACDQERLNHHSNERIRIKGFC